MVTQSPQSKGGEGFFLSNEHRYVVVAGHICLDIIPAFRSQAGAKTGFIQPGSLTFIGPAVVATGGAVSNTGLALHRLGIPTHLMGKVGKDLFGGAILDVLRQRDPALADCMIVAEGEHSSYTLVINPPDIDRSFLHCPGANDTFTAADVDFEAVHDAALFHFGYPPLMECMHSDGGAELERLFREAKRRRMTTSLDLAQPDPDSPAGRADWEAILQRVLPWVDVFLPSLDETLYMVERKRYSELQAGSGNIATRLVPGELSRLCGRLLDMGAAVVGLKLGDQGFYLRTSDDAGRLARMGRCTPADTAAWRGRELLAPCFVVRVEGTTGSGDCTIAGFLAAFLKGLGPVDAAATAVAAGACNVERADAISGVRSWDETQQRLHASWSQRVPSLDLAGFRQEGLVWHGPGDSGATD